MERFRRTRVLSDDDTDALGHVNNVVWVRFVVELAEAHSAAVGLDWPAYRELGASWVVHRHEVDYRRPGLPGEEIAEETWISLMRGARCVRRARFFRPGSGETLVEARTTWVFADLASGRPRRVAPTVLERFPVVGDEEEAA